MEQVRVVRCCHGQFYECQSITNNALTRFIHGPFMNGHLDYSHYPSMDEHLADPLYLSNCRCHSYCVIHGPSMDATVTSSIIGPSTDGHLVCTPLSKYPWIPQLLFPSMCHPWIDTLRLSKYPCMVQLLCLSMDHPWMDTSPDPLCRTIHGPGMDSDALRHDLMIWGIVKKITEVYYGNYQWEVAKFGASFYHQKYWSSSV